MFKTKNVKSAKAQLQANAYPFKNIGLNDI